ncbi:MAG: HD domain-containing protein [Bdellovibrionaceae bacterium]|jgi:HD-GYP domain-containing protein (c-di-GMP phosphodiesterase class II)|nr:HD domain-containing protein [Pseudobdellovibrionaceae bacterium]
MEATNNYVPIRVSTLRGELKIPFNAYVRIANKHILYCRMGDSFAGDRLAKLKKKKLKKMFILDDQETQYRDYLSQSIDMAYDKNSGSSIESRADVIQGSQQASAEEVMENPEDQAAYKIAKDGTAKYVDFIMSEDAALKSVINIENTDQSLAHHGVTVATLALGMAQKLNLDKSHPLNLLTLGALLHDFELTHLDLDMSKPRSQFTEEELAAYKNHPKDGVKRVGTLNHFDQAVTDIIFNHEEFINGSGFPRGLKEKDLDLFSLITSTANAYDRLVAFECIPKTEALKRFMVESMGLHKLEHMQALKAVLKDNDIL